MPIYEFYCPDNHKIYSFYARSLAQREKVPRCPDNSRFRMERLLSKFSVTGRAKEKPEAADGPGVDDPRMEAAMAQMEREFGSMDSENPDPRQLGRMMRKMCELSGEKMPGGMDEMIRRMEAGEDPEKLEEEFGDAFDEAGEDAGLGGEDEAAAPGKTIADRLHRLRNRPTRDPVLYEMSEFVD